MLYQLSYVGVYSREIVVSNASIVNYQFSIPSSLPQLQLFVDPDTIHEVLIVAHEDHPTDVLIEGFRDHRQVTEVDVIRRLIEDQEARLL